jgi:integrase
MKLIDVVRDLYAPLRGISDRTVEIYAGTFRRFGEFLGHEPTVADLEEITVAKYLAHRVRTSSLGSAAKCRACLRAVWEFCAKRKLTETWPEVRTIRVPERVPRAWLIEEFQRLLEACETEYGEVVGVPARLWFRAIVLTAYWTGERIGALLTLEWADVEPEAILFRAETRKGRREDIYRPIPPECYAAIQAIRTNRKLVFDWDRSYTLIWGRLGKICERAGLPNDRMSKFHRVRKTSASYFQAGGGSAQSLMGHRNPATTRRYLDPRIVKTPAAPEILPKVS